MNRIEELRVLVAEELHRGRKVTPISLSQLSALLSRLEAAEAVVEAARELASAAQYAIWQHHGGGTNLHNHWSVKLERNLSACDTALTRYQEAANE